MHVGHIKAYSSMEVLARKRRMQGYNVLFPIGYDAFGLPTENYAIKTNTHPRVITDANIAKFSNQLKSVGFSFDWSRTVDTSKDDYYKWTQWIFLKLFDHGLVFRDKTLVNYCPHCKVVLSNEDSQGGKCDICHTDVIQLPKDVWYLKITDYADKLLTGLDDVDYPEAIKQQEVNWIGKSTGAFVNFTIDGIDEKLEIYTTRPDTLFGVTFMVMAPEHPLIDKYQDRISNMDAINAYRDECAKKTEFERTQLVKDKTGLKIEGLEAVNPVNGKKIPIFIADYVMMGYGTGAIMAVPAHDQRDWDFAHAFGIDIIEVIQGGDISKEAYTGDGLHINSGILDGLNVPDGKKRMIEWLEEHKVGQASVNYKLRDWLFSRQRYWGEPFPILWDKNHQHHPLPEEQLPLTLPDVQSYAPSGTGESPLANIPEWLQVGDMTRETNTMPQWAGSCWYYLRYIDPNNDKAPFSEANEKYWMPVDFYIGGAEHAVLHLLYARFWHKVLYDIGLVHTKEPFQKLFNQGMILAYSYKDKNGAYVHVDNVQKNGDGTVFDKRNGEPLTMQIEKMSKSRGNVVNPDDVVRDLGADSLRLYEMFMGPLDQVKPWDTAGVAGVNRFLTRCWKLIVSAGEENVLNERIVDEPCDAETELIRNQTIKKLGEDIENLSFNTGISQMMVYINHLAKLDKVPRLAAETLVLVMAPYAPHLAEELWAILGHTDCVSLAKWPDFDPAKCEINIVNIAIQVCGKLRGTVEIDKNAAEAEIVEAAKKIPAVARQLEGKNIVKTILVPGRILNFIAK